MAEYEGWLPSGQSSQNNEKPSVSYRNHNPGNLRYSIFQLGIRDNFAYFYNDTTGMFAMRYDIMCKCQGKTVTGLSGESTLRQLIAKYANVKEEALDNYFQFVIKQCGFGSDIKLKEMLKQ